MNPALDVYGLRVGLEGEWPEVVDDLVADFAWFRDERPSDPASVTVRIDRGPPDFDALGDLEASFVTPRNVVYQDGTTTVVDYFGRAVSTLDRQRGELVVRGESRDLVHEAAYLFLLSRIGEHLDARHMVR